MKQPEPGKIEFLKDDVTVTQLSVPRCQSWLGHKFQPRFDEETTGGSGVNDLISRITSMSAVFASELSQLIHASKNFKRRYVADVCVRCGHAISPAVPLTVKPNADKNS